MKKDSVYLARYAYPNQILPKSNTNPGIIVIIPAFKEPNLLLCLQSIYDCHPALNLVEIIVVINQPADSSENINFINKESYKEALQWVKTHQKNNLFFHVLFLKDLPKKDAGVGLARKIGMDEAVRKFEAAGNKNGVIVCLDADCICEKSYLQAIEQHFKLDPTCPGATIYYEHPVSGDYAEEILDGITQYELFLRYYVDSLRLTGYPYAWQTVGSCMAFRSEVYQKQGGMNKRKAGEDFYFINKIVPLGNFGEINNTKVIPSPRISDRVPFGTGKAMDEWLQGTKSIRTVYNPIIFDELSVFFSKVDLFHKIDDLQVDAILGELPAAIRNFLMINKFSAALKMINGNCRSLINFKSYFFRWFDAFLVLKFVHFARDNYYPQIDIKEATTNTLQKAGIDVIGLYNIKDILKIYRELDRSKFFWKFFK